MTSCGSTSSHSQKKKRELVLHIGLHKTGTSFIQRMIAANIAHFRAQGIEPAGYFNPVEGQHHLLLRCLKEGRNQDFFDALENDAPTTLVTTEGFTTWLHHRSPGENRQFAERIAERFDVRVVIVLRRQDFLKESVYAEVATSNFVGPIEAENHYPLDFDSLLEQLEDAFGLSAIRVGVYRDDVRQDIFAEFLRVSGIALAVEGLEKLPPQRVSLHRRKVSLLATVPKRNRKLFRKVRQAVAESTEIADDGVKYHMSPEARREVLGKHLLGNRRLCERYRIDSDATNFLTSDALSSDMWKPMEPFSERERSVVERVLHDEGAL